MGIWDDGGSSLRLSIKPALQSPGLDLQCTGGLLNSTPEFCSLPQVGLCATLLGQRCSRSSVYRVEAFVVCVEEALRLVDRLSESLEDKTHITHCP